MVTSSTRERPTYRCSACGRQSKKWVGRCPECHAWDTVEEVTGPRRSSGPAGRTATHTPAVAARPIPEIGAAPAFARPTGVGELDRVLGGGLVPGSVALLAGEPGVGKSTLLLDVAARSAAAAEPSLVVTGEESAAQVRLRAGRIGALIEPLYLAADTDLADILAHLEALQPGVLVLDSVQSVSCADTDGAAGGVTQVREVATTLIRAAKERRIATVLVGHVTKDGSVAGPRVLEHLVDVVLHFEGERHSRLRMLRATKNRFGSADEVGCFDLREDGIVGLPDPSGLFLSRHATPVAGTCVTVTIEGKRPLVAEVQALVARSSLSSPRRSSTGLEASRVAMILAVLERRARVPLASCDVYTATVGGMRITEPASDLALALAARSAAADQALPSDLIAIGEVGLAGEIRRVGGTSRRLAEAARLGFTRALVPPDPGTVPDGMAATEVANLPAALDAV